MSNKLPQRGDAVSNPPVKLPSVTVALNMCREANTEVTMPTPMCWDLALYVANLEKANDAVRQLERDRLAKKCEELMVAEHPDMEGRDSTWRKARYRGLYEAVEAIRQS
jgi:hypothetical protein